MALLQMALRRLGQMLLVLFTVSVVTFALMRLAPGDPIHTILKPDEVAVTAADEAALRQELGLDQPLPLQYLTWLGRVVQLDLGTSYGKQQPVRDLLVSRLPATLALASGAMAVLIAIAFPLGILAAVHHNRTLDHISRLLALAGASFPSFWLGLLLISLFSNRLHLLPSFGSGTMLHLVLPAVTLGLAMAGVYARLLRTGLLESFGLEYIRSARARGLPEWRIVIRHGLKAALLPVITIFGMSLGSLLGGTVVVEAMFSWPGLGKLAVDAILKRDYPVIQGYVLLTSLFVMLANLAVDLSYRLLDPRTRHREGAPS